MSTVYMAEILLMVGVNGVRVRARQKLCWMNGVKVALGSRGITVEAAQK